LEASIKGKAETKGVVQERAQRQDPRRRALLQPEATKGRQEVNPLTQHTAATQNGRTRNLVKNLFRHPEPIHAGAKPGAAAGRALEGAIRQQVQAARLGVCGSNPAGRQAAEPGTCGALAEPVIQHAILFI